MADKTLWSFTNALFFLILFTIISFVLFYGVSVIFDIKKIQNNWAEQRCSPLIMPFASVFGYNTKENFEFCMGKTFNTFSQPFLSSTSTMFASFTSLLTMIFGSISSLRNTLASLGGGINIIVQEFVERISSFFFRLRVSAITIKQLIGRMYAILFSVMYMGLSGISGISSFTNTFLFSFLNVFCFPGSTKLNVEGKGSVEIKEIQIGDILLPTKSKVTATFRFFSKGQPMVKLGSTIVSTNHYVYYLNKPIMAGDHPEAEKIGDWNSEDPLYCLNTSDNKIPVDDLVFLDYDETPDGDKDTMNYIEGRVNSCIVEKHHPFTEYCSAIDENTTIKTVNNDKLAKDVKIGDKLVTGSEVVGLVRRVVEEIVKLPNGVITTPSTMYWNNEESKWERFGDKYEFVKERRELVSFIVVPNSQIELKDGLRIRDYMELCSPDSEIHYSKHLESESDTS